MEDKLNFTVNCDTSQMQHGLQVTIDGLQNISDKMRKTEGQYILSPEKINKIEQKLRSLNKTVTNTAPPTEKFKSFIDTISEGGLSVQSFFKAFGAGPQILALVGIIVTKTQEALSALLKFREESRKISQEMADDSISYQKELLDDSRNRQKEKDSELEELFGLGNLKEKTKEQQARIDELKKKLSLNGTGNLTDLIASKKTADWQRDINAQKALIQRYQDELGKAQEQIDGASWTWRFTEAGRNRMAEAGERIKKYTDLLLKAKRTLHEVERQEDPGKVFSSKEQAKQEDEKIAEGKKLEEEQKNAIASDADLISKKQQLEKNFEQKRITYREKLEEASLTRLEQKEEAGLKRLERESRLLTDRLGEFGFSMGNRPISVETRRNAALDASISDKLAAERDGENVRFTSAEKDRIKAYNRVQSRLKKVQGRISARQKASSRRERSLERKSTGDELRASFADMAGAGRELASVNARLNGVSASLASFGKGMAGRDYSGALTGIQGQLQKVASNVFVVKGN